MVALLDYALLGNLGKLDFSIKKPPKVVCGAFFLSPTLYY
jgi:hypothetical protein